MSLPPPSHPHGSAPAVTADPRQVEGWALSETALRMNTARQEPVDEAGLLQAVRLNWRLWTIFQASLFEPDCPLPADIRNNILSLANFVDKHTAAIIADPDPSKLDVLIGINRELASGLLSVPQAPAPRAESVEGQP
jgi:flagellar biosynthesis activator protein FlaF